jgi:hypothetical protein
VVNAYLIYKENYDSIYITMIQFRERLVRSLRLGAPFENLKPGPRQQSTSQTKRKLADHKLEEIEDSDRDIRKRCAGCYEKIRQQEPRGAKCDCKKNKNILFGL